MSFKDVSNMIHSLFPLQLSGFFKGMYYPLLSAGALNSLFFGVYGITLRSMTENREGTNVCSEFHRELLSCLHSGRSICNENLAFFVSLYCGDTFNLTQTVFHDQMDHPVLNLKC